MERESASARYRACAAHADCCGVCWRDIHSLVRARCGDAVAVNASNRDGGVARTVAGYWGSHNKLPQIASGLPGKRVDAMHSGDGDDVALIEQVRDARCPTIGDQRASCLPCSVHRAGTALRSSGERTAILRHEPFKAEAGGDEASAEVLFVL